MRFPLVRPPGVSAVPTDDREGTVATVSTSRSLQNLIDDALVERDTPSGRRLAEIAQDAGFVLTHTTVNAIRGGTYKSRPEPLTIRAIAWLAKVTDDEAFAAAGLRVPGPPFAEELPPGVDYLSPEKRRAVIGILRVLVQTEDAVTDTAARTPVESRDIEGPARAPHSQTQPGAKRSKRTPRDDDKAASTTP